MNRLTGKNIFFQNLDGLRSLSFIFVFFVHSFPTDNPMILKSGWYHFIKGTLFADGEPGVSFFFVLSGFLITFLLLNEHENTNTIKVKSFYMRRILRIWPLYYFCVFFGFVIFPYMKRHFGGFPEENANPFFCSIFMNNFDRILNGPPDSSVLGVLWSVAIEEQFYLLWPLLFFVVPVKYYAYIFIFVIEISIVYRIVNYSGQIDVNSLGVVTDMALGGLGAFLSMNQNKFKQIIKNSNPILNLIPYAAILFYIIYKRELFISPFMIVHRRLILGSLFAWIILEQNFCERSFFKAGNNKLLSRLGKYTYGLYCLHMIALLTTITILKKFNLHNESWQLILLETPIALLLSFYLSYISYNYFESYFLKMKRKFTIV